MHITIITSPFGSLPPNAVGAVEKLFHLLAGEWMRLGHSISFVCAGGGNNPKIEYVRLKKYGRTGSTKKDIIWDFFYSIKALWKCPKTDILLCNTFWTPALAPFFRWKYKKLVYGVHRYPKGQFWLYPFVHAYICVSSAVADELRRQLRTSKGIWVVNNPVDLTVFCPPWEGAIESDGKYSIVYAGRVHPEKGLDLLFDAAAILSRRSIGKRIELKIIGTKDVQSGGGGSSYVDSLSARQHGFDVNWIDAIRNPSDLAMKMRRGNCFAYPSVAAKGETFGVAPLEAMAIGMPVVLSNLKCFSDFVQPGINAMQFELGDGGAERLADAIEALMVNLGLAKHLSENASKTASKFSPMVIALSYEKLFAMLLSGEGERDER